MGSAEKGYDGTPLTCDEYEVVSMTKVADGQTLTVIISGTATFVGTVANTIAEVIIKHDIYVMSDEIYSELSYKEKHVSIAQIPGMKERTILINGFSKAFAMTGWRLGMPAGRSPSSNR